MIWGRKVPQSLLRDLEIKACQHLAKKRFLTCTHKGDNLWRIRSLVCQVFAPCFSLGARTRVSYFGYFARTFSRSAAF